MNWPASRHSSPFRRGFFGRILIVLLMAGCVLYLNHNGTLEELTDQLTFKKLDWYNNPALVHHLQVRIHRARLTKLPSRCLVLFLQNQDGSAQLKIDVLARKGNGCPGDQPGASLLFHLLVDRNTQSIMTDKGSPGLYYPMSLRGKAKKS